MPYVNIKIAGALDPSQVVRLQREATKLMVELLGKKAALTAVLVEQVASGSWAVGAEPASVAAHLEAKVTAGTNSALEKERFIAAAHKLLGSVLGPSLPEASYVVIDEVPGDAWGYSGLTQAFRANSRAGAM